MSSYIAHCKNSMVVLTHIRSTQFHGTTECTVKCIYISKITLLRETQLHRVSVVGIATGCKGKVCVVNWPFYPFEIGEIFV